MRDTVGRLLQLVGLLLLPLAVIHGLQGGSIYDELLLAGAGVGLLMMGRGLRGPGTA